MTVDNPRDGFILAGRQIIDRHLRYDNSLSGRCNAADPNDVSGLDCSTFVALSLINAGLSCPPCTNSWALADQCRATPRPDWFSAQYGPGVGTEVSQDVALNLLGCCWFHMTGEGHIEVGLGNNGDSMGAHSHATGIGYSTFGAVEPGFFDYFAVLPQLLPWFYMPPKPKVEPQMDANLRARLRNPGGQGQVAGWWEAYDNGLVDFLGDDGVVVHGGMNSPADVKAFAAHGESVAELHPRMYGTPPRHGYTIVSESGHTYVPENQR